MNKSFTLPEERIDGWYFKVTFGPFETKEKADKLAWELSELEEKEETLQALGEIPYVTAFLLEPEEGLLPPPTLGINVTETITAADRFG